jgi:hypothetical protein
MQTSTVGVGQEVKRLGRGTPLWALDLILVPILEGGLREGHIRRLRGRSDAELVRELRRVFGCGIKLLRESRPINLPHLAGPLQLSQASVRTLLERIEDWNWLIDNLRFAASDRGQLDTSESVLVLKSMPVGRSGSSIFGVASRSMPEGIFDRLEAAGLAPPHNPSPNSLAIDCSVWLVEIAAQWQFALRVEPLPEGTWFDLRRYDEDQRPIVQEALADAHGLYTTSTKEVVRDEVFGSFLASAVNLQGGADGAVIESGCLQHGPLGIDEVFVGARLDEIRNIERAGARAFLDLARVPVRDPDARRRMPKDPWSGTVRMGEEDCTFEFEKDRRPHDRAEMTWAAQMELGLTPRRSDLEGIFRPVSDRVLRLACPDPSGVRYVVSHAWVGKGDVPRSRRQQVGFLIRDYRGELGSGWSVPFDNILQPAAQVEAIKMAEDHLQRVGPRGEVIQTVEHLRGAGVQGGLTRGRLQIQAMHGMAMAADILDTRARLYI